MNDTNDWAIIAVGPLWKCEEQTSHRNDTQMINYG